MSNVSKNPRYALVVLSTSTQASFCPSPPFQVGGLTVLRRCLLTLQQAGFHKITVLMEEPRESIETGIHQDERLKSVQVIPMTASPELQKFAERDFLVVLADKVFTVGLLNTLLKETLEAGSCVSVCDEHQHFQGLAYCRAPFAKSNLPFPTNEQSWPKWLEQFPPKSSIQPGKGEFIETVRTQKDAFRVEQLLIKNLGKETASVLSRNINRRISLFITKRLIHTSVTPNQMTLIHTAIGLLGAVFFAQPSYWAKIVGSLLFLFSSTVDGCDGEISRLKFQQSELGGWLDIWADNVVHIAVFSAIALGLYRENPIEQFLWLGLLSCSGVLLSAGTVSWKILRHKTGEGNFFVSFAGDADLMEEKSARKGQPKRDRLRDVDDFLARRDFIYLLVPLAAFGKLHWFLWASAVGGNLFFLSLLVLYARR